MISFAHLQSTDRIGYPKMKYNSVMHNIQTTKTMYHKCKLLSSFIDFNIAFLSNI